MKVQKAIALLFVYVFLMGLANQGYADPCFDRRSRGIRCERQAPLKPNPQVRRESRPPQQPAQWTPRNQPARRRADSMQSNSNWR